MIDEASNPQMFGAKGTIPLEIAMPTKETATSDLCEKRLSAHGSPPAMKTPEMARAPITRPMTSSGALKVSFIYSGR